MMVVGATSGSFAIIPRNDSAQPLFALDLALVRGLEIWMENLVANIHSLMRALVIVVRKCSIRKLIRGGNDCKHGSKMLIAVERICRKSWCEKCFNWACNKMRTG